VVGILETEKSPWNETVYAPFTPLRNAAKQFHILPQTVWNDNVLDFFFIKGVSPTQKTSLDHLINERTVAQILWLQPEIDKLKDLTGQSSSLFELMAFLIGFLSLVALSGLLISEVQSLETQILTLRAMGYSQAELYNWMALEGFFMAVFSVLLGIVLDLAITPLLQDAIAAQLPVFRFSSLPIWSSAPLWIFILFCVPLSLLIPMHRILKKSLSAALRK
jgi:ABC-type lipoprotein release transport system permease subunit